MSRSYITVPGLLWILLVVPAPGLGQSRPQELILRVTAGRYGQEGVSYGVRRGVGIEVGFEQAMGRRFFLTSTVHLMYAPYYGDDYELIARDEGKVFSVPRPGLAPLPSVRVGGGVQGAIGRIQISLGPELGVLFTRDAGVRVGPISALLFEAGLDRIRGHVRAGVLGMPITWEQGAGTSVRNLTEWWRFLEFGVALRPS